MLMLVAGLCLGVQPVLESFVAPGFAERVSGVWYAAGQLTSPMPLGGLGTGFIELNGDGTLGAMSVENDWLKPKPVSEYSGFVIEACGRRVELLPGKATGADVRFWGHFPCADLDFGNTFGDVQVRLRAFAPLVAHDYGVSGLPAALFKFSVANRGPEALTVRVAAQWQAPEPPDAGAVQVGGGVWRDARGSYALGSRGEGWTTEDGVEAQNRLVCAATRRLAPGETAEVWFGIGWHFPEWMSSDGELLRHRYAREFQDAGGVLQRALEEAARIEEGIIDWQSRVYGAKLPPLLQDAVINGLYVLARNSWWLADGRFFLSESFTGCPITETLVCRFNGSFPLALLWPACEKAAMAEFVRTQAESGQIAFGFGTPLGSRTPMMDLQRPIVSTEFVLLCWRNFVLWKDEAYLREVYPAMKRAMQYALTLDTDGDGLVNEAPGSDTGFPANQYYDIWPWWGTSAYTGSICLAALRAAEMAAEKLGDDAYREEIGGVRVRAQEAFERLLWNGSYYRLYNDPAKARSSETSLTNALCGQWFAYAAGLGELVSRERVLSVIDTVLRLNDGATGYGAVNGVRPDGMIDDSFGGHSAVITIGEVWNFCAMAAFAGRKEEAIRLFEESYGNVVLRQCGPWNIPWSYKADTGEVSWGVHYYSNPCVWTLYQALDEAGYESLAR